MFIAAIYPLFRRFLAACIRTFYPSISVTGKERLVRKGPLLIVANHPNTIMDPLVVAQLYPQRIGFVAKSGIFINAVVNALLRFLHVIPIYRTQDAAPGEKVDNTKSFIRCFEYLKNEGSLLIFPEGVSVVEMKLRPIKTGAARIAFDYEAKHGFKGGLKIQAIGLNYFDATKFRTRMTLHVSEPITLDWWSESYAANPVEAIRQLTLMIEKELENGMLIADDAAQELVLKRIHTIYSDAVLPTDEAGQRNAFLPQKELSRLLKWMAAQRPDGYRLLEERTHAFIGRLNRVQMRLRLLQPKRPWYSLLLLLVLNLGYSVLLLPFYVFGLATNYPVYHGPSNLARVIEPERQFKAGLMLLLAMVIFPAYYLVCLLLARTVAQHYEVVLWPYWWAIAAAAMPLCGLVVLHFNRRLQVIQALASMLTPSRGRLFELLQAQRVEIEQQLVDARNDLARQPSDDSADS